MNASSRPIDVSSQSKLLLASLTAGALIGISEVMVALSMGSLIFSGELAPYLSFGIGIALVTATVTLFGISLFSSVPGVIGSIQDSPSVILALMASALFASMQFAKAEEKLTTILVAIAFTTIFTGLILLALGNFKLGGLVRYLPYPVLGGFLAGTGWLLVQGSFGVMSDFQLTISNLEELLSFDQLVLWGPGVIFGIVLFLAQRYSKHYLTLPGILIGGIVIFYLALMILGISVQEAMDMGLLLGTSADQSTWQPIFNQNFLDVDWAAILGQSGNIAILLILCAVSLLLNASAIEVAFRKDLDLNHELRIAGVCNLVSGFGGGAVGFQALSLSCLSLRMGVLSKLPGIIAGSICAVMLFARLPFLAFTPVPILGGLLLFMGLGFLVEWVVDGWDKLPRADYFVVLSILVVIGVTNFLVGVAFGLAAMILLFVLSYSRINVVRHTLSGAEMKSNVSRWTYHQRLLRELGGHILILELQGFVFFGTANTLLEKIRMRLADKEKLTVRFLVLDFRHVIGIDSSAVYSFIKVMQWAESEQISILFTHLSDRIKRQFERAGLLDQNGYTRLFPDLDRGLECCESELLEINRVTLSDPPVNLKEQLAESGFNESTADRLMKYLDFKQFAQGESLIHRGEIADDLFFIEIGEVSIFLELETGEQVRLQTLGCGTIVGELGLFLGTPRTASVIANAPTFAYRLSREALGKMKLEEPELSVEFHEYVVRMLSERLIATNRLLEVALQ